MTTSLDQITQTTGAAPRRPWVTPQVILAECKESEAGNGVYASDFTTTNGVFTGS